MSKPEKKSLTPDELAFYNRHIRLPQIGIDGQTRLKEASVFLVGLGGLGSPMALYLTAAGVGRIGIIEFDPVDVSNLHRQVLYGIEQVGQSKLENGVKRLRALNPYVQIETYEERLTRENARELIRRYDLVADGTDNFATRYLVNDACVLEGKPLISASILGFEGQLAVFHDQGGPCYRCLYPEPPPPETVPSCAENGVLGVLPGVIGTLQATEVIKLILRVGEPTRGRLLYYDALSLSFSSFRIARNPQCAVCGDQPVIRELVNYEEICGAHLTESSEISPLELKKRIQQGLGDLTLVDVRDAYERDICQIEPSTHVPLATLFADELPLSREKEIIAYCQMGDRSAQAVKILAERGFGKVRNLKGGILRWIEEVDPSLTRY